MIIYYQNCLVENSHNIFMKVYKIFKMTQIYINVPSYVYIKLIFNYIA